MTSKGDGKRDAPGPRTRVRSPRPPRRDLLEADPAGAPTREHAVPSLDHDPHDALTRVERSAPRPVDDAAPTRLRPVGRRSAPPPEASPSDSGPPPDSEPPPPPDGGDDIVGRRLGNCVIGPAFASGGLAAVHLGHWFGAAGFTKTVAVKRLHRHMAKNRELVTMLLDEARVVAQIRHANVMSVLDVVEHEDEVLVVMELVHGVTLAHLLRQMKRRGQSVPVPVAMQIAIGVLHGIQAAHAASDDKGRPLEIIHRDVSPENIVVGTDGCAQLIDFGFARALGRERTTQQGQIKGKLLYCSPEQLRGEELEAGSDIFAASNVIWEMVCGRRLFADKEPAAVVQAILESNPVPPSQLRDGLSDVFDAIVLRGLDPDPHQRWLAAADMAEALERVMPKATLREVGDWVHAVADDKLSQLMDALEELEALPPPSGPPSSEPVASPRKVTAVAAQPSSNRDRGLFVVAGAIVLLAGIIAFVFGGREASKPSVVTSSAPVPPVVKTVLVSVPVPAPPPPPSASAIAAPPPRPFRPPPPPAVEPKPKDWIPDGI